MRQSYCLRVVLGCAAAIVALFSTRGTVRADETHWALVPPVRAAIPETEDRTWSLTPIDAFVLAKLEALGLPPSPAESRRRLIRRVTLDLTGLPPTYQEVCEFLNDPSPRAYEELVDRLLASPHCGERLGQLWLDVVRYADSDGFEYDTARPSAWRYRDWVIGAFNEDMPYDQFIREQIAGDELAPDDLQKLIPTGLHRLGPLRENAGIQDLEKNRQEILVEMTDAVGSAFLGLTVGCAKCHDHKFDPISQEDYYCLQAFFAATIPADAPMASAEAAKAHERRLEEWNTSVKQLQQQIAELEKQRSASASTGEAEQDTAGLANFKSQLEAVQSSQPQPLDTIMAVSEMESETPPTYVLLRGVPGQHGQVVQARFPRALREFSSSPIRVPTENERTGRRRALAEWLTAADHPLTARVLVNRLWQHHFGRGLVSTPNDFGLMGEAPSHPQLLDWLATEFVRSGWSIKHIQRLIVTSASYRQSSQLRDDTEAGDPQNVFLSRMPARRLDAETLRDAVLAVSGRLNRKSGGPGVRVMLPAEISSLVYKGTWDATTSPSELARRSIYRFVKRNLQPPLFAAFDAPDTLASCARRNQSTHAGQALILLNSPFIEKQAANLAGRLLRDAGSLVSGTDDVTPYVRRAYELALSRKPSEPETRLGAEFIKSQLRVIGEDVSPPASRVLEMALGDYCLVVLNLDEFLFY